MADGIVIGGGGPEAKQLQFLLLSRANRHGLVAGATGTGKTVTLQTLAEQFSAAGVPVFCADIKGDLSGLACAGDPAGRLHDKLNERSIRIGVGPIEYRAAPVTFWDVWGKSGHPVRATVSDMGPQLLARLLQLNETQQGVLTIAFQYADDQGLLLVDLKDLRSLLAHVSGIASELQVQYGNIASASVGAVQRQLLLLEREGGEAFFGEPALEFSDLMRTTPDGRGYVNVLDATRLIQSPRLYSTFLMWLLAELYESLPEVGDPEKPKLIFFFDEAHLLFSDAPKALIEKIEQVVRLVRSKGVGIYFVTQNPKDLPETVLAQLGCRIQHALRAYTPQERKGVRAAAQSFRPNPRFDAETAISELATGEALVSTLDASGIPTVVERTLVRPPSSRVGPLADSERTALINGSSLFGRYDQRVDRSSAHESLNAGSGQAASSQDAQKRRSARDETGVVKSSKASVKMRGRSASSRQGPVEAASGVILRTAAREFTKYILRGMLGSRKR
jgi:DNA helicase HerA-like ATPase